VILEGRGEVGAVEEQKITIARRAPVRSASQPQKVGTKTRASCGIASTAAICCAPKPLAERYSAKYGTYAPAYAKYAK